MQFVFTRALKCFWFSLPLSICLLGTGCTIVDPEYKAKLPNVRTSCKGQEIVGIWVFKGAMHSKNTVLFRLDGTGVERYKAAMGNIYEIKFTWRYLGSGKWEIDGRTVSGFGPGFSFDASVQYTGSEMLRTFRAGTPTTTSYQVLVRADDEQAVERAALNDRAWDDWKEDNHKGSGNKANKRF